MPAFSTKELNDEKIYKKRPHEKDQTTPPCNVKKLKRSVADVRVTCGAIWPHRF
jgi:hypothetical protein